MKVRLTYRTKTNCILLDCVYDHFQQSSQCPSCGKVLGADDFMDLCIAEAPVNPIPEFKTMFQKVFTKGPHSTGSQYLNYMDACLKALEMQNSSKKVTQFVFQQLCLVANKSGRSSGRLQESYDRLRNELTQLQQSASTQRMEAEQAMATAENRYQTLHQKLTDSYNKNKELLEQVEFFRQQIPKRHGPSSSTAGGGGGAGGSISSRSQGSGHSRNHHHGGGGGGNNNGNRPAVFPNQGLLVAAHNNHSVGGPDPTPIRIMPSFDSTRNRASGAPAMRNAFTSQGYVFSSSSNNSRNHSMSSGSGGGGPVRRMQQSHTSRPTIFGRPLSGSGSGSGNGGFLGGGHRR